MDDKLKQVLITFSKVLKDFSVTLKSYADYEEAVYKAFGEDIDVTNVYANKLSQEFQEAGYIVAMIAYMVLDDATKNIVLKVGDDGYPEVKVKVSNEISSKELMNKLDKISEIVWNLSDEKDELLWVSVTFSR